MDSQGKQSGLAPSPDAAASRRCRCWGEGHGRWANSNKKRSPIFGISPLRERRCRTGIGDHRRLLETRLSHPRPWMTPPSEPLPSRDAGRGLDVSLFPAALCRRGQRPDGVTRRLDCLWGPILLFARLPLSFSSVLFLSSGHCADGPSAQAWTPATDMHIMVRGDAVSGYRSPEAGTGQERWWCQLRPCCVLSFAGKSRLGLIVICLDCCSVLQNQDRPPTFQFPTRLVLQVLLCPS